jgi:hypothetical protein
MGETSGGVFVNACCAIVIEDEKTVKIKKQLLIKFDFIVYKWVWFDKA